MAEFTITVLFAVQSGGIELQGKKKIGSMNIDV